MSIAGLLKRLILVEEPVVAAPVALQTGAPRPRAVPPRAIRPAADSRSAILLRDAVIDIENRICGYRFRASPVGAGESAASTGILQSEAVKSLAAGRMAIVHLAVDDWRTSQCSSHVAPGTVVLLDAPRQSSALEHWLDIAREIKASGARIALQGLDLDNAFADGIKLADMVFLDLAAPALRNLEFLAQTLKQHYPALQLAVDNVASWPERRLCLAAGVQYCLGSFMSTRDGEDDSPCLNQSRLVIIEMLNLLRQDADLTELGAVARRDPAVAMQIVGMANSPLLGPGGAVAGLDQAIMRVGREWLYRSLSISMFRVGARRGDEALLEMSLARARLMELAAAGSQPKKVCEEMFLVGLLSLLDRLLNQRMSAILARIKLPTPVVDALLRNDGPYAPSLMLAMAIEAGNAGQAHKLAQGLGLTPLTLEEASLSAMNWAHEAIGG